jgi:RNA polymerase sigma-70 factor (ECF subfamily)
LFLKNIHRSDKSREKFKTSPDQDIISEYRKNMDPEILGVLFDRYIHLVFGVCMKYLKRKDDARDATMEIFENLFGDLLEHEIKNFPSWLHTVSKNFCLMKLREKKWEIIAGPENLFTKDMNKIMESDVDLHHNDEKEAELAEMEKALFQLSKDQEQCVRLFYLHNRSYREVAEITGYSLKKVKSHIQNGKRNMKNYLIASRNNK